MKILSVVPRHAALAAKTLFCRENCHAFLGTMGNRNVTHREALNKTGGDTEVPS